MDLTVVATYRCDSKCSMCHIWQNPTDPKEEVSIEALSKLPGGFDNLNVSGGEPTLRQDLVEIIDVLYPKAKTMEISSNGLHAERIVPIIKKYPDVKVRFSLEGGEATSNSIRGEKNGFQIKVDGLKMLKEAGGKDLGFALTIQDENAEEIEKVYQMTQEMGVEMATSTLHNAWQFHKNDNYFYDRLPVAKEVEKLITAMLKTMNVKNWFRAYLNLGLIRKILGQDRLIPCTAGTEFIFIDPWADVWACNVRTDLPMGNLFKQSWEEILESDKAKESCKKVAECTQNCWMVTTARTAMRSNIIPGAPKLKPLKWVIKNKIKLMLGRTICFNQSIDYSDIKPTPRIQRTSYLDKMVKKKLQKATDPHYVQGTYVNE